VVIGSGPDIEGVKERVEELGLSRHVIVKGRCTDEEMYRLMKTSEMFVFPSMFEGWGLAVAEALACGLPVVCYDIPALREVFGGCTSVFFVPVRHVEALVEAILKVAEINREGILTGASMRFVERFKWSRVAEQDLRVLRSCSQR
jgi:glycosyltransferase involved in cell wall biosynthesis